MPVTIDIKRYGNKPNETTLNNVKKLIKGYGIYKSIDQAVYDLKKKE